MTGTDSYFEQILNLKLWKSGKIPQVETTLEANTPHSPKFIPHLNQTFNFVFNNVICVMISVKLFCISCTT